MKIIGSLVFSLVYMINLFGQTAPIDEYGRSPHFIIGSFELPELKTISIESNSIFEQALKRKIARWGIQIDLNYEIFNLPNQEPIVISKDGTIKGAFGADVKNEYDNLALESTHVFSLGLLELSNSLKQKIKWLDFNPALGEENDFSKFNKLNTLTAQNLNGNVFFISPKNFSTAALRLEYPGSPFFWNNVAQISKLKTLQFDVDSDHTKSGIPGNLYLLNPPESNLFKLKQFKNIQLGKLLFLPVCFREYKDLAYMSVENISTPELVNLAVVMHSFGKDTTTGNWRIFLEEADLNRSVQIPENGMFESFYKNGNTICRGNYKNGEPDGVWEFWYSDGKLCQKRTYINGIRNGTWFFYAPVGQTEFRSDTISKITYNNGLLTALEMIELTEIGYSVSDCDSYEFQREVEQRIEYRLDWKSLNNVEIRKTLSSVNIDHRYEDEIGDTLKGHVEHWLFDNDGWTYHYEEFCQNWNETFIKELKGKPWTSADYSFVRYMYRQHLNMNEAHWTIDLEKCFQEYIEYSNNGSGNDLEIIKSEKKELSENDWSCKP